MYDNINWTIYNHSRQTMRKKLVDHGSMCFAHNEREGFFRIQFAKLAKSNNLYGDQNAHISNSLCLTWENPVKDVCPK